MQLHIKDNASGQNQSDPSVDAVEWGHWNWLGVWREPKHRPYQYQLWVNICMLDQIYNTYDKKDSIESYCISLIDYIKPLFLKQTRMCIETHSLSFRNVLQTLF